MVVRRKATGHTHGEMLSVGGLNEEVCSRIYEKTKRKGEEYSWTPPPNNWQFDSQLGEPE